MQTIDNIHPSTAVVITRTIYGRSFRSDGIPPIPPQSDRNAESLACYERRRGELTDDIARRAEVGIAVKRTAAMRPTRFYAPIPKHKALVPVGRVRRPRRPRKKA